MFVRRVGHRIPAWSTKCMSIVRGGIKDGLQRDCRLAERADAQRVTVGDDLSCWLVAP